MRRAHAILGTAILGAAALVFCTSPAVMADRVGGPAVNIRTIGPYQTLTFNISFLANKQAVVAISGNNSSALDLRIYDGDGHVTVGTGNGDQKAARVNVYRTGSFVVEVHNLGQQSNTFYLMTN
jgi:hypothetical protein